MEKEKRRPPWWPENPYPTTVFTMTEIEYKELEMDDLTKSRISGFIARWAWDLASTQILEAWGREQEEMEMNERCTWFGKGCKYQANIWERECVILKYKEYTPISTSCTHDCNLVNTEGNCKEGICPGYEKKDI